ncbi:hypothetical protein Tco_0864276 [Tanacetum coccineum]
MRKHWVLVNALERQPKSSIEGGSPSHSLRQKDSARENVSHSDDADQQSGNLNSTSQIDNAATLFDDVDEVYEMSSGDEDETTGMKIDHAAQKEREKKEREEEAAEGGWTVVGQHKGRKKTTEAESGRLLVQLLLLLDNDAAKQIRARQEKNTRIEGSKEVSTILSMQCYPISLVCISCFIFSRASLFEYTYTRVFLLMATLVHDATSSLACLAAKRGLHYLHNPITTHK